MLIGTSRWINSSASARTGDTGRQRHQMRISMLAGLVLHVTQRCYHRRIIGTMLRLGKHELPPTLLRERVQPLTQSTIAGNPTANRDRRNASVGRRQGQFIDEDVDDRRLKAGTRIRDAALIKAQRITTERATRVT